MTGKNGRTSDDATDDSRDTRFEATDDGDDDADDDDEYGAMMLLDQLESLEEEMMELGVTTLDELRARIREMHDQLGDAS